MSIPLEKTTTKKEACSSFIRQFPPNPHVITGYLIRFFQFKFSSISNINEQALRKPEYLWTPNNREFSDDAHLNKKILITSEYKYSPEDANQRPAVVIARSGTGVGQKMSIGNKYHSPNTPLGTEGWDPNYLATLGHEQQLLMLQGAHTILCSHSDGGAAEILGLECWHTLLDWQHVLRKELALDELVIGNLQKTQKLEEFKQTWSTPIMLQYKYQRSTLIRQESPILKAFNTSTGSED